MMSNISESEAPAVIIAEPHDADRIFAALTLAFAADPPCRWISRTGTVPASFPGIRSRPRRCRSAFANSFRYQGLRIQRIVAGPRCQS